MSRYDRLYDHLVDRDGTEWRAEFRQIEAILGDALPRSAHQYPAWWANQSGSGHIQSAAWQRAGWKTTKLDLEQRMVTFSRLRESPAAAKAEPSLNLDAYLGLAAEFAGTDDRDEIVLIALRDYVARGSARALADLGGTMPDYVAPPRRRDAA